MEEKKEEQTEKNLEEQAEEHLEEQLQDYLKEQAQEYREGPQAADAPEETKDAGKEEDAFPDPGTVRALLSSVQAQSDKMDRLIRYQIAVKDEQINTLYEQLAAYRKESAEAFSDQLMKAVIRIRTGMEKEMASDRWEELSADEVRQEYRYACEDLSDLLEQQNVDPYVSAPGAAFDPAIHQAKKVEQTTDPAKDRTVKESVSAGWRRGDKVLITERVVALRCQAPEKKEPGEDA